MAFSLTTTQMRTKTKTVTRRKGWSHLKPGDRVCAIVKGMGLKKGEKVERIGVIEIVSNEREYIAEMLVQAPGCKYPGWKAQREVDREGFVGHSPVWFVRMFCTHNHCPGDTKINRIEFKHL